MSYLLIDDVFAEHPKIEGLSDKAFRLHVTGLLFCARNLTDGRLTDRSVKVVCASANASRKHVVELRDAGLWLAADGGFEIKDYLEHNPKAEVVKKRRADAADRQRRHRERNALRNGTPDPDPSHTQVEDHQVQTSLPTRADARARDVAALVEESLGSGTPEAVRALAPSCDVSSLLELLPSNEIAANTRDVLVRKFSQLPPRFVGLAREELIAAGDTPRSRVRYLNGIADRMIAEVGRRETPQQARDRWLAAHADHPDVHAVIDSWDDLSPIERQAYHERADGLHPSDTESEIAA